MERCSIMNIPVYTKAGSYLGKIKNVIVDSETQQLLQYYVKKHAWSRLYIVHRTQVYSLENTNMIVDDTMSHGMAFDQSSILPQPTPNSIARTLQHEEI